ncbi:MAG TPA: DNA-binding protein, partial [Candidatus Marinimicrobia bacterium]|nr:DNA-binding protein [Candidatus Neomarinimicrobiota bacterium]
MAKINVMNKEISFYIVDEDDYISITDIAKYKNQKSPADIIKNWLRNRMTIEFLGIWEKLNNPEFKLVEFDQ